MNKILLLYSSIDVSFPNSSNSYQDFKKRRRADSEDFTIIRATSSIMGLWSKYLSVTIPPKGERLFEARSGQDWGYLQVRSKLTTKVLVLAQQQFAQRLLAPALSLEMPQQEERTVLLACDVAGIS